jgi:protein-S-isoprenylcysteine O-methyltransferase Ste14
MISPMASPWWYRRRSLVIFFVYLIGFVSGDYVSAALTHRMPVGSYETLAAGVRSSPTALLWAATALAFIGFLLRFWGSSYLSADVVWSSDALQGKLLVDGPFRYVRNPLYLGNILQAVAIGMLGPPPAWALIVTGTLLFAAALASHEAHGLKARYGEIYERYARTVPAFIPRLRPAKVEGSVKGTPSAAAGSRAEVLTFTLTAAMAGYAATRMWAWFWLVVAGWLYQSAARTFFKRPGIKQA